MPKVIPVNIPLYVQAPGSALDYTFDWNDGDRPFLVDGDTIATATWSKAQIGGPAYPDAVTISNEINSTTTTLAFVTGTRIGQTWRITCAITTAAGRRDSRSVDIVFATT